MAPPRPLNPLLCVRLVFTETGVHMLLTALTTYANNKIQLDPEFHHKGCTSVKS